MSKFVPIYSGDDFRYAFQYKGGSVALLPRITSVSLFIKSVVFHFLYWNARLPAIIFEMLMPMIKQSWFEILNGLAFVTVGLMINVLALGKRTLVRPLYIGLTFSIMMVSLAEIGQATLWHSGTANYLWVAPIYLLFLLPYVYNINPKYPVLRFFYIIVFGVLAGTSNEIAGPQVIIVAFLLTFFDNRNFEADWKWIGIITAGVSAFISIFRDGMSGENSSAYGTKSFQIGTILSGVSKYSGILILANLFLILLLIFYRKEMQSEYLPYNISRRLFVGIAFFIAGVAGIAALMVSPVVKSSLFFSANILFIVALLNLLLGYEELRKKHILTKLFPLVAILILILVEIPKYQKYVSALQEANNIVYTGVKAVNSERKDGQTVAKVPGLDSLSWDLNSPFSGGYVQWNPKGYHNLWYAKYHGMKSAIEDNSIPIQGSPVTSNPIVVAIDVVYNTYVAPPANKLSKWWYGAKGFEEKAYAAENKSTSKKIENNKSATKPETTTGICTTKVEFYNDRTGKLVGSQKITAWPKTNYDIRNLYPQGYTQDAANPQSYKFTNVKNQTFPLWVHPNTQNYTVQYNVGDTIISTQAVSGLVGDEIMVKMPYGYKVVKNKQLTQKVPVAVFTQNVVINIEQKPFWQRLPEFWALYLILLGFVAFLGLDKWIVASQNSKVKKESV